MIFFGAYQMLRLQSYAWSSMAAAIISIIACSLIGLPVGIWALIVLAQPEVREAFKTSPGVSVGKGPVIGMAAMLAIGAVGVLAVLLLAVGLFAFVQHRTSGNMTLNHQAEARLTADIPEPPGCPSKQR